MSNSPIFIVGCPRSGTALLRDLLRSHPQMTFPGESHFIPKLYKAYGDPRSEREAYRLAKIILNLYWVRPWGLSLQPAALSHYRSFGDVVSRIYEEYARKENKPRWGDKTPEYILNMQTLLGIFPSCKFIHIYRDGRDVALSWLRIAYGPENVFTAANAWKAFVNEGRRVGENLSPDTYFEVKYENLITNPEETMKGICTFLNEPFSDAMLKPNVLERRGRRAIIGQTRASYVAKSEIVSMNHSKWKREMSRSDRVVFESIADDLLTSLGYETEGFKRQISKLEQSMWKGHDFCFSVIKKLNLGEKRKWVPSHLLMRWASIRATLRSGGQSPPTRDSP